MGKNSKARREAKARRGRSGPLPKVTYEELALPAGAAAGTPQAFCGQDALLFWPEDQKLYMLGEDQAEFSDMRIGCPVCGAMCPVINMVTTHRNGQVQVMFAMDAAEREAVEKLADFLSKNVDMTPTEIAEEIDRIGVRALRAVGDEIRRSPIATATGVVALLVAILNQQPSAPAPTDRLPDHVVQRPPSAPRHPGPKPSPSPGPTADPGKATPPPR